MNRPFHRIFADNTSSRSVATRLRRRRFRLVLDLLADLPGPIAVLDVGGRQAYWDSVLPAEAPIATRLTITLLNLEPLAVSRPGMTAVVGDARSLVRYRENQFDLVFSNSMIEHVETFEEQRQIAAEIRRVGRRYCVQTPNRYFPIEPHFLFPGFQFLPLAARVALVRRFRLGWCPRLPDAEQARACVQSIRLLTRREVRSLFPEAVLYQERFLGWVKSFVAYTEDTHRTPG
ncbi:MAG: methyltransferase domain-containing protein [Myxococcota bacterium]